jgi:DNA replication protein DnaC
MRKEGTEGKDRHKGTKAQRHKGTQCKWCGEKYTIGDAPCETWAQTCCSVDCAAWVQAMFILGRKKITPIPAKYLERYNMAPDRYILIRQFAMEKTSTYLWGNAGTGKTVFACEIAKHVFQLAIRENWEETNPYNHIHYISYPEFIVELQCMYGRENESPYRYLQEIARYPHTLVIDDLGAEKLTEFVRQTTYHIINTREQWRLHTIVTSNFSLSQIATQIDPRVASRIAGMCEVIEFTGKDQRLRKRRIQS